MQASPVPRNSSEDRGFLQDRIALFARNLFVLIAVVPGIGILLVDAVKPGFMATVPLMPWSTVSIAALGALWLFCRRGAHSATTLAALDAATTILAGTSLAAAVYQAPPAVPPGLPTTFFVTYLLVARAIVVPSNWSRTLWISGLAALPTIAAILMHAADEPGPRSILSVTLPMWCVMAVLLATWTSNVLYRLRRSVQEARQLGQYTLEAQIGEGGMGVVFRARHAMLRRPTVIKLLPPEKAGEANLVRFEREVQITSRLSSPNTVAVYDFGRTDDGVFYYAMEYLDGIDLERLIAESGPQPPARVIHALLQVCAALSEAHEAGLIHRDVKPSNVMLCRHGGALDVIKVLDFGLVKDISADRDVAVTRAEAVLGTPLYVSPEAITDPAKVDERSDLYAVGALGYYLVTGRTVFEARTVAEVYARHLYSQPPPPSQYVPEVPADLETLLLACLEKDPYKRPRTARALRAALLACADAGAWTEADAHAWWQARATTSAEPVRAPLAHADTVLQREL